MRERLIDREVARLRYGSERATWAAQLVLSGPKSSLDSWESGRAAIPNWPRGQLESTAFEPKSVASHRIASLSTAHRRPAFAPIDHPAVMQYLIPRANYDRKPGMEWCGSCRSRNSGTRALCATDRIGHRQSYPCSAGLGAFSGDSAAERNALADKLRFAA